MKKTNTRMKPFDDNQGLLFGIPEISLENIVGKYAARFSFIEMQTQSAISSYSSIRFLHSWTALLPHRIKEP